MVVFLVICAVLELLWGLAVFSGSKSAIHEILGMLAVGFAILTAGLAAILAQAQRMREIMTAARAGGANSKSLI
jgi:hypothetical protein